MKFTDKHAKLLIVIGVAFAFILTFLFLWNEGSSLSTELPVNDSKLSSYGTILSGLVGTCWTLASVILFYVALTEQRKDMGVNRAALQLQTDALTNQIKEFELQTKELEATRKVYIEQSATQQIQRFESTFFQMLSLHHNIVDSMALRDNGGRVSRTGRDSFRTMHAVFKKNWDPVKTESTVNVVDIYLDVFDFYQGVLSHYYRNLYHIFKFIAHSEIKNKKYYASLARAQLSSYELLFLVYNSLSKHGSDKFKPLVEEYALLKNLNWEYIEGGKDTIRQFKPKAFGKKDFAFLDTVRDWI